MSIRESLRARPDVPDADIDDIIGIAARLQDEARRPEGASIEAVKAVAAELDIAPEHVEAAIGELERSRDAAQAAAREAERAESAQAARTRSLALSGVGALTAALLGLLALIWVGGRQPVMQARSEVHSAEAHLGAALDRQASLALQLVGLAGAGGANLEALQARVREAEDLEARLVAADALSAEMARSLGALPPPEGEAAQVLRVQLTDEITGSQNRVGVELRRYREAEAVWRAESEGALAKLAIGLGLAEGP